MSLPKPSGYTLFEILLVLVLISSFAFISAFYLTSSARKSALLRERDRLVQVLFEAQQKSVEVTDGKQYSVSITSDKTYSLQPINKLVNLPPDVTISQPAPPVTVSFAKLTGKADKNLEIILVSGTAKVSITVSEEGTVKGGQVTKL